MRINDAKKGDGPEVTDEFARGDSWVSLDGPHMQCKKARQVVQGVGLRMSHNQNDCAQGILMRCSGCMGSYVLTQNS